MIQQSRIVNLFELGEEGILKDNLTGARVFIFSQRGWREFNDELESTFFDAAQVVMERMGYAYGKVLGRAAKKVKFTPNKTFESLFELGMAAGWGRLSLGAGNLSEGTGVLKVDHCVFCESLLPRSAKTCHFLPGVVRGVADEVTGKPHSVAEIRCICRGDAACEISLEIVGSDGMT